MKFGLPHRLRRSSSGLVTGQGDAGLPCRTSDPDLWFSDRPADLKMARSLCKRCPLRRPCLEGAIERQEPWGVWGGEIFERGAAISRKRPGMFPLTQRRPDGPPGSVRGDPPVRPTRLAEWLTGLTVRVLPAVCRDRYREEFAGELCDLSAGGASRWRQLAYAWRLVDRAAVLRAELQGPAKSQAAP
jgi:hypothetical protein